MSIVLSFHEWQGLGGNTGKAAHYFTITLGFVTFTATRMTVENIFEQLRRSRP